MPSCLDGRATGMNPAHTREMTSHFEPPPQSFADEVRNAAVAFGEYSASRRGLLLAAMAAVAANACASSPLSSAFPVNPSNNEPKKERRTMPTITTKDGTEIY